MKQVRVNVQLMDENDVIISSFEGIQFTGVMDENFIYAKRTYGSAPDYVQIPISSTHEATDEYTPLPGFATKELRIPKNSAENLRKLDVYSTLEFTENTKIAIHSAVKAEEMAYASQH